MNNPILSIAAVQPRRARITGNHLGLALAVALLAAPGLAFATTTPLVTTRPLEATPTVRAVESPPLRYAEGPTLTGRTQMLELPDAAEVDHLCSLTLGPAWPKGYWMGCYNGNLDTVIVPAKGAWPSERERQALIAHEWAHARGWTHEADGRFGRPKAVTP